MTASAPLAHYGAVGSALASGFAFAELNHHQGHDRELSHDTSFTPSRAAAARFISSAAGTPLTAGTSPLIS